METSESRSLAEITAQHLYEVSKETEDLEALAKAKRQELDEIINLNTQLYGENTKEYLKLPNGLPSANFIVETNKKLLATLEQEVHRDPIEVQFKEMSLLNISKQSYGRDDITMKTYDEIEVEISNAKEAIQNIKQNILETANQAEAENAEIENYIKDIERETDAIQKASICFESDESLLFVPMETLAVSPNKTFNQIVQQIWEL